MSNQSKNTLKSYFIQGARPTEGNFVDLVDSLGLQTQVDQISGSVSTVIDATTNISYDSATDTTTIGSTNTMIGNHIEIAGTALFDDVVTIPTGAIDGYILTSDADGNSTWKTPFITNLLLNYQSNNQTNGSLATVLYQIDLPAFKSGDILDIKMGGSLSGVSTRTIKLTIFDGANTYYDIITTIFSAGETDWSLISTILFDNSENVICMNSLNGTTKYLKFNLPVGRYQLQLIGTCGDNFTSITGGMGIINWQHA